MAIKTLVTHRPKTDLKTIFESRTNHPMRERESNGGRDNNNVKKEKQNATMPGERRKRAERIGDKKTRNIM